MKDILIPSLFLPVSIVSFFVFISPVGLDSVLDWITFPEDYWPDMLLISLLFTVPFVCALALFYFFPLRRKGLRKTLLSLSIGFLVFFGSWFLSTTVHQADNSATFVSGFPLTVTNYDIPEYLLYNSNSSGEYFGFLENGKYMFFEYVRGRVIVLLYYLDFYSIPDAPDDFKPDRLFNFLNFFINLLFAATVTVIFSAATNKYLRKQKTA